MTDLLVVGESLGVDSPEPAAPCLAVRGRPLLLLRPPLSLRLSRPLLGSEFGVSRPVRGVPELLRRRTRSLADDKAGDPALEATWAGKKSVWQDVELFQLIHATMPNQKLQTSAQCRAAATSFERDQRLILWLQYKTPNQGSVTLAGQVLSHFCRQESTVAH